MNKKTFFTLSILMLLPAFVVADAPPPPPFNVNFTYESRKISDAKFYAVALQCQTEKNSGIVVIPQLDINQPDAVESCSWLPRRVAGVVEGEFCTDSTCYFNWVHGQFKLAVYIPSLGKTFISEVINREYLGHYGSDTQTEYDVDLLKDNSVVVAPPQNPFQDDIIGGNFLWMLIFSLAVTIILESIVALVFVLLKKAPKKIFFAVLIGNTISVPFVWIVGGTVYPLFYVIALFVTEIIAVVFETWVIRRFVKDRLSWKMCLLISLTMNIVSFIVGLLLIFEGGIYS